MKSLMHFKPFAIFYFIYYFHFVLTFNFYDVNACFYSSYVMSMDVCDSCDGGSGDIPTHVIMFYMVLFLYMTLATLFSNNLLLMQQVF